MAEGNNSDGTLMKIAIFCIAMSVISTCMFTFYLQGSSDYDYDTISAYRSELTSFSGGQLVNDTPWVLTGVYTPFTPQAISSYDIKDHIERDKGASTGWLYGEKITDYPYLNKAADIKLDPSQKSNQLLSYNMDAYEYHYNTGEKKWWAGGNPLGIRLFRSDSLLGYLIPDPEEYIWETGVANNWNYTGYRYVFDPTLPFNDQSSSVDGRLSLVWYSIPGDTGLSGALEVYAGKDNQQVKLGSISSKDIITAVRSADGYVKVFDFNFEGTHLNLTIRFDPTVYQQYNNLQSAWDAGAWAMAISSASAGNFFDVENSNAFSVTAGSVLDTFIQIYTFSYPHFDDAWIEFIMWVLVGLPMTLAMMFITMRLVGGVFKIF